MATTIRFGTTSGPCKTAAAERAELAEDFGKKKTKDILPHFQQLKD